jgi:hypothetical protein
MNRQKIILSGLLFLCSFFLSRAAKADDDYVIGNPDLKEIWVDPVHGVDLPGRGSIRTLAYKSLRIAWGSIPENETLTNTGFVIKLVPGNYLPDDVPAEFQSVLGTAEFPVIITAADDTGSVNLPSIDVTSCKFLYFIGLNIIHNGGSQGTYAMSFRRCDHILLRDCHLYGSDSTSLDTAFYGARFYQCPHTYIEHCEIAHPSGAAIDLYAVEHGHIKQSDLHNFGGSGIIIRGGSAYFTIEENAIAYGAKAAVQFYVRDTTIGLDNMVMPWVHYEAYDIKCFNNIIHHINGPGLSCNGGYNILFAFNTLYQTGLNSPLITLSQARRGTAVDQEFSKEYIDAGGWGTWYWYTTGEDSASAPIPNKNIFIYNNIFSNDSASAQPHFSVSGPLQPKAINASCPRPALADDNVVIKGNIIWNGEKEKPLGINANSGCGSSNPSCNEEQLINDNLINIAEQKFVDPDHEIFRPVPGSIAFTISKNFPIPDFSWADIPPSPVVPAGNISNTIKMDRDSNLRTLNNPIPGAYILSTSSVSSNISNTNVLLQAYPNPVMNELSIEFHLSERAYVSLEIYTILGEKIATLLSSALDGGDHHLQWKPNHCEAGTYFCRLQTENMIVTKQISVLK